MSWWTDDELARFGYFELDGARSPGVLYAMELGDGTELKWEAQNGFGLSGEFTRFLGLGLAEFTFKLKGVDAQDRADYDAAAWRKASKPPVQGQADRPRAIRHPLLERHPVPIKFVTMRSVPFEVPGTDDGGAVELAYRFKVYRKQLPQPVTPKTPDTAWERIGAENPQQQSIRRMLKGAEAALLEGTGIPAQDSLAALAGFVSGGARQR